MSSRVTAVSRRLSPRRHRRQRRYRLMLEHRTRRDHQSGLAGPADQLDRHDAVAAKLEEVVVDADRRKPQRLGKQRAQHLFVRRARQPPHQHNGRLRRGQRPPVELAVRRQRQPLQHHERRRHHVVRQQPRNMRPQCRCIRSRSALRRHHVGHQPQRSAGLGNRVGGCPHRRRATTAACATPACRLSAASISPGSMRKPRSFTCASARPRNSSTPSWRQRARSPVRYIRPPAAPNGSATNRSAVRPERPR